MTEREHRLRMRIDTLLAERDQALDLVTVLKESVSERPRRDRPRFRSCPYCGRPCYGRACHHHRDLVLIEETLVR